MNKQFRGIAIFLTGFVCGAALSAYLLTRDDSHEVDFRREGIASIALYQDGGADRSFALQDRKSYFLNPPQQEHKLEDSFVGLIVNALPQISQRMIISCEYLILREEPQAEFWQLSYFPEGSHCFPENVVVNVQLYWCSSCQDDLVKIVPLVEL